MQTRTTGWPNNGRVYSQVHFAHDTFLYCAPGSPAIGSVADPLYLRKSHKNAIIGRNQRDYVTRLPDVRWGILMQR